MLALFFIITAYFLTISNGNSIEDDIAMVDSHRNDTYCRETCHCDTNDGPPLEEYKHFAKKYNYKRILPPEYMKKTNGNTHAYAEDKLYRLAAMYNMNPRQLIDENDYQKMIMDYIYKNNE